MKSHSLTRIWFLFLLVFLFAFVLIVKLYFVQIVNGEEFKNLAERQYTRPSSYVFDRGTIYFKSKDGDLVPAAMQKSGYTLSVNPENVKDAQSAYDKISQVIPLESGPFLAKATKTKDVYEEIADRLDIDSGKKIAEFNIPGVTVSTDKWRFYPGNTMAAQTIGFVGYKGNDKTMSGVYGLEKYYEDILKRNTESLYVNFFAEMFANIKATVSDNKNEGDIVASIEPTVQSFLEQQLASVNKQWSSDFSGGIIINPQNGEIYAMALDPSFNLNDFSGEKDVSIFTNKLVQGNYEMGSIIKALTMASGLDSGVVTPRTTYNDTGCLKLNGKTICNHDGKARGVIGMQQMLNESLNVGATFVQQRMGNKLSAQYLLNFGLGEKTGVDLPDEASGLVSSLKGNVDVDHATASFGQGIAMTPMAITRALSALANGGTLITPHLATEINYKMGLPKKITYPPGKQVIKKEAADSVTRMLVQIVDVALKNGNVKLPNYSVAAKTGTAQIAKPGGGGYYDDRYLHSFFGYFPAYNAKFLIFLYTYYPKGAKFASETLTQTFMDTTKFLINYYNVPPDR
jgi:cell division protein FtsI/penicillin-binding protein 2